MCLLLVQMQILCAARLAEDQEINSAGWNWAGVASIWGVARTEEKLIGGVLDWKVSNKPFHLYPKDTVTNTLWIDGWWGFFWDTSTVKIIYIVAVGGMFEDSNCSIVKSCWSNRLSNMVSGLHYLDTLRCIDLQPGTPELWGMGLGILDFGFYLLHCRLQETTTVTWWWWGFCLSRLQGSDIQKVMISAHNLPSLC